MSSPGLGLKVLLSPDGGAASETLQAELGEGYMQACNMICELQDRNKHG